MSLWHVSYYNVYMKDWIWYNLVLTMIHSTVRDIITLIDISLVLVIYGYRYIFSSVLKQSVVLLAVTQNALESKYIDWWQQKKLSHRWVIIHLSQWFIILSLTELSHRRVIIHLSQWFIILSLTELSLRRVIIHLSQ